VKHVLQAIAVVLVGCGLSGCVTGLKGAPKTPFESRVVEVGFNQKTEFNNLVEAKSDLDRNAAISKMLGIIDVRYNEFRHNVVANRKHLGAATGVLELGSTIAGGLTDSLRIKDRYLAFSALLQGGEAVYDQNYLFEQTLSALTIQMDASRKARLAEIRARMARNITEYPGIAALSDVMDYYQAGTLVGAVTSIQQRAADQKTSADDQLSAPLSAVFPSADAVVKSRLQRMVDQLTPAREAELIAFMRTHEVAIEGATATPAILLTELQDLQRKRYAGELDKFVEALRVKGFTVP